MLLRDAMGRALRRVRLEQGLTLREVSLAAAISVPYLSEIERGRKEPSSEVLAVVARVLGLRLVDLLDLTREETVRAGVVVDLATRREWSGGRRHVRSTVAPHGDRGVSLAA